MLSYDNVLSTHYNGKLSSSANTTTFHNASGSGSHNAMTIPAGQIKSGNTFIPPTVTSFPRNISMPQNSYFLTDKEGNISGVDRTANRIYIYKDIEKGPVTQFDDYGINSWKALGEEPQVREYVRLPKETSYSGVIESFAPRKLKLTGKDTPVNLEVHDFWVYDVPNNKIGKYHHQARNLKQSLTNYYRTKHAKELDSFLSSLGFKPAEDIGYLAVGLSPERSMYAVNRAIDGKIILFAARDVYDKLVQWTKDTGLTAEDIRIYALDEEFTHIKIKSLDKVVTESSLIPEEIRTKSFDRDFYAKEAREAGADHKKRRKYEKYRDLKQWDIDTTPERYKHLYDSHEENLESRIENAEDSGRPLQNIVQSNGGRVIYAPREAFTKKSKESSNQSKQTNESDKSTYESGNNAKKVYSIKERTSKSDKAERRDNDAKAETASAKEAPEEAAESADTQAEGEAVAA